MAPRFKDITFNFIPVKVVRTESKAELRRQALGLYKAWYKQIPAIMYDYRMPISAEAGRSKLREIFVRNSRLQDPKMINSLIMKGQMELNESVNKQKEDCHLWKYFRSYEKRPETFLGKFLEGR